MSENEEVAVDALSDDQVQAQFECYGVLFDHTDETCVQNCYVRDRCIGRMGSVGIPEAMKAAGPNATVNEVAELMGVPGDSVAMIVQITKGQKKISDVLPPSAADREEEPEAPPEPPVVDDGPPPVEDIVEVVEVTESELTVVDDPPPPPKKKAKKKAPPKKKAKKKAAPKKKVKAKKKAPPKALKKKPKKVAFTDDVIPDIEDPAFQKAYDRERNRSELVGMLVPNQKLTRDYKGQKVTVFTRKGFYEYNGNKYPTLYSILMEVTTPREFLRQAGKDGKRKAGTRVMSNWSVTRFFRLQKA